jgi:hypothetical protein
VKDQNLKRIKPVWKEICKKKLMMSFKKGVLEHKSN